MGLALLGIRALGRRSVRSCWQRSLSTDLTSALRPFYFAVHPDFFGKHPVARQTNEESLKLLSSHLESLSEHKSSRLPEHGQLKFFMRRGGEAFSEVQIQVDKNTLDPRAVIQHILETCNLLASAEREPDLEQESDVVEQQVIQSNLDNWMRETAARAQLQSSQELSALKDEVGRLERSLVQTLGLRGTRYDCGCNMERYRGCLSHLEELALTHGPQLQILRNRLVVFAPYTGISLDGHVMLFTGDAPSNWCGFISEITLHETYLKLVPLYEQALSAVLLGIQIKRRHRVPTSEAKAYANSLLRVITSLSDHLNVRELPEQLPSTLKEHKLAIVPESEQPQVSQTGLFLAPASCSGHRLIEFICSNLKIARDRAARYQKDMVEESELLRQCKESLGLDNLTKDDSVTPDKMVLALRHLLTSESKAYENISIHVTNYYSVLTDGIVCIPWDFMYRKAIRKLQ